MPITLYSPSLTSKPRNAVNAQYSSPERMGEHHLLPDVDLVAASDAPGARHPLTHAVHGQDGGFVEGRAQKRAGGVRQVMFAEQNLVGRNAQLRGDLRADPQLVDHPGDHRLAKDLVRLRIGLQHGHQDAVELAEGLLVEDDVVQVAGLDARALQAELDGLVGKVEVVLDAAEALFFGGGDQLAVLQQSGRGVVVVAGDSQDIHVSLGGGPLRGCWGWEDGRTTSRGASSCAWNRKTAEPPAEGQDQNRVDHREKDTRLKVADGVPDLLPAAGELRLHGSRQADPDRTARTTTASTAANVPL